MNTEPYQPKNYLYPPPLNNDESGIDRRVGKVVQMMMETLVRDFQLEDLASAVDLSPRHLERLFKRDMD